MIICALIALSMLGSVLVMLPSASAGDQRTWVSEGLDYDFFNDCSAVFDSTGTLHVAYIIRTNQDYEGEQYDYLLYRTKQPGGSWEAVYVWGDCSSSLSMGGKSIAVDSNGKVYVCFGSYDRIDGVDVYKIRLASKAPGGTWVTSVVSSWEGSGFHRNPSLALDPTGEVHVCYLGVSPSGVFSGVIYATWVGTKEVLWEGELVADHGTNPILAIDSSGVAHVGFMNPSGGYSMYATNRDGAWQTYPIEDCWLGQYFPQNEASLALDSQGNPHMTYCVWGDTAHSLSYVWSTDGGSTWHSRQLAWSEPYGNYIESSLVIDLNDKAHIVFVRHTPSSEEWDLHYATEANSDGSWSVESIPYYEPWYCGQYPVLAVDPAGMAHAFVRAVIDRDQEGFPLFGLAHVWVTSVVKTPDVTPPTTSHVLSGTSGLNGWYVSDVGVSLSATDDSSGVASTSYSTDGGSIWFTYTGTITVSTEGVSSIQYKSIDNAGNEETPKSVEIKIDKTAPTISGSRSPGPNGFGWNNGDVTVSFTASDSGSDLASVTSPVTLMSEGEGQSVSGTATDVAGNTATTTVGGINIDKTAPTITGSRSPDPNSDGWNNGDVTVVFLASDSLSSVDTVTPDTVLSEEGSGQHVVGSAVDKAGNSAVCDVTGINIDKTAPTTVPTLTGTVGLDGAYVSAVEVSLASSDGLLSGVDKIYYNLDSGGLLEYSSALNVNTLGDHEILYYATDLADNQEIQKSVTFRIEQNLEFDESSTSITAINVDGTLVVKVTDDAGNPIEGVDVTFSGSPNGLVFGTMPARTGSDGMATITAGSSLSGVYLVTASTSLGATSTWTLVIYDPAGMTAGGGWYYPLDDEGNPMPGTASFGFVAKYIKYSATGNLEFQYHVDDKLNLKSSSIEWLVVGGSNAQFKGQATLNGVAGFTFHVIAHDGTDGDTFSIRIWDSEGNLIHSSHDALAGGNIVVRTKSSTAQEVAPAIGGGWLTIVCTLLVALGVGLRQLVSSIHNVVENHRQSDLVGRAASENQKTTARTRKLRYPCALARLV